MEETHPGQTVEIVTDGDQYNVELGEHPNENIGFLGGQHGLVIFHIR